ncbi:methyltransferase [Enterococcus hirae]|nr:methyltransferase [Enterococcus hirae]
MSEIFNQIANHYDTPERKALAKIIQDELISQLPSSTKELTFMDYGGGTGLVSLALADRFKQLLLVDSSDAMLTIAEDKIKTSGLTNVSSVTFDATTESIDQKIDQKVDLILMSLVLLHIPDTRLILEKLYHMLTPNGQLLIIDFDHNDAINHPKVHNGFDHEALMALLEQIGFHSTNIYTFHSGKNLFMKQDASLFFASGKK